MSGLNETLTTADSERSAVKRPRNGNRPHFWPWGIFVVGMLLIDFVLLPAHRLVVETSTLSRGLVDLVVIGGIGCLSAQACLMAVLGGLIGKSWVSGFSIAALLSAMGIGLLLTGEELSMWFAYGVSPRHWQMVVMVMLGAPLFVLAVSTPTLAMRQFYCWTLTRDERVRLSSRAIGLEDLFIGTAIVAAGLVLAVAGREIGEMQTKQFWLPIAICYSVMASASLVIVLPTVWVAFRVEKLQRRILLFAILSVVFTSVVVSSTLVVNYWMPPGGILVNLLETAFYSTVWMIAAAMTFLSGLSLLRFVGFRLTRRLDSEYCPTRSTPHDSPSRDQHHLLQQTDVDARQSINHHRRWAAAVFAIAIFINQGASAFIGNRTSTFRRLQQTQRELSQEGGGLALDAEQAVVELSLGSGATREDIQAAMVAFPRLKKLSLANSDIVDSDLKLLRSFPLLQAVNLNGTPITDAGLAELVDMSRLAELSVADTQVTIDGIVSLLDAHHELRSVDVSNLGLTDEDLERLLELRYSRNFVKFSLRSNPVSMWGVMRLKHAPDGVESLDLADCQFNADSLYLLAGRQFIELTLDGTPLTDTTLASVLPKSMVRQLSFDRTQVTDAILPHIAMAGGITGLKLGESQITEAGLARVPFPKLQHLDLTSPKFDGSCFKTWKPLGLQTLSLSGSAVSDRTVTDIVQLPNLRTLDLSHTSLTDTALSTLARSPVTRLDLSHTQVTAAGLAKGNFSNVIVHLSIDQFSVEEFKHIRRALAVSFEPLPRRY